MSFYPYDAVTYNPSVSAWQIGQQVTITPSPGAQSLSYTITAGTLPTGLSLNNTSGIISGIPTMLTPASTVSITCVNADSTVFVVNVNITITNIPVLALTSNQVSAMDRVALQAYYENIFLIETNTMILNQNQLGLFELVVDLPWAVSFNSIQQYFVSLGYNFWPVYWRQNNYNNFALSFGAFNSPAGYPFINPRAGYSVESVISRKVRITWSNYPYNNNCGQWYPGYPSFY